MIFTKASSPHHDAFYETFGWILGHIKNNYNSLTVRMCAPQNFHLNINFWQLITVWWMVCRIVSECALFRWVLLPFCVFYSSAGELFCASHKIMVGLMLYSFEENFVEFEQENTLNFFKNKICCIFMLLKSLLIKFLVLFEARRCNMI